MASADITRYRQAAENARKMATRSKDPKIRDAYQDIALQYEQLAAEASRAVSKQ